MSGFRGSDPRRTSMFSRTGVPGLSKLDLERDSGFSDASSEYLSAVEVTDSEDAGRSGSIFSQEPAGPQVAVVGGSYQGLSPMIIMNNFVLKQPSPAVPAEKQWNYPSSLEVMPQSQVVLLQPMVSNGNGGTAAPNPASENVRQSKSFTPVPKSYPRIAPHPGDAPTKRAGSSRAKTSATPGYEPRQRRHHHSHKPYSYSSPQTATHTISCYETATDQSQAPGCPEQIPQMSFTPQTETGSVASYTDEIRTVSDSYTMSADKYQEAVSVHSNKLKRFSNTYNILNKSGLLGITMRTKQLIKDNKRTQGLLVQLQEQTSLLLEALSSGDPELWTKLQLSLQDTEKEHWAAKSQRVLV